MSHQKFGIPTAARKLHGGGASRGEGDCWPEAVPDRGANIASGWKIEETLFR